MVCGIKIQIYPTKEQEEQLLEWCKVYHNMWNFLVEKYKNNLPVVNKYGIKNFSTNDLMSIFKVVVPDRLVLGVIKTYAMTVNRFYNKLGYPPKFHKYNPNKQSFYLVSRSWKISNNSIPMPVVGRGKTTKSNRIFLDEHIIEKSGIKIIKEPRFTKHRGNWFLSGTYEKNDVKKDMSKDFLGLDWGIKNFMTTSEGEFINYPKSVLREYQRVNKLRKVLNNKQKGSNNYGKLLKRLIKAYQRFENLKKDFAEKKTSELCKKYNISVEEMDGFNASQSFMRRQNMVSPKSLFVKKLEWKCEKFGSYFIKVDPAYTSQTCCKCGQLHNLTLRDRTMVCNCGNVLDRDINAAINIRNRAIALMVDCHNQ